MTTAISQIMYENGHKIPTFCEAGLKTNAYENGHKVFPDETLDCFQLTIKDTEQFSVAISASGDFTIDWGDGISDTINKTNTTNTAYTHDYTSRGNYYVKIRGLATGYNTSNFPCLGFPNRTEVIAVAGDLGAIFPQVGGVYPQSMFFNMFLGCSNLVSVRGDIFKTIYGATSVNMFRGTFQSTKLATIPASLFSGLTGAPASSCFNGCFSGTKIKEVPATLFHTMSGTPASAAFQTMLLTTPITTLPVELFSTFSGAPTFGLFQSMCSSCFALKSLPAGLFSMFGGATATGMFYNVFSNSGLESVPDNLFGTFTGNPTSNCFNGMFYNCVNLATVSDKMWDISGMNNTSAATIFDNLFKGCSKMTSSSPTLAYGNTTKLWEKFTAYTPSPSTKPFTNCTLMADYDSVPSTWK